MNINPVYMEKMIHRIISESPFLMPYYGKCGSAEAFVYAVAEKTIRDWMKRTRGKPPWKRGRWKTRGGRDQDRWRKRYVVVKLLRERKTTKYYGLREYCRISGIPYYHFTPETYNPNTGIWRPE